MPAGYSACMPWPDDARAAFLPLVETIYLDTASNAPRLRAVDTAARAALDGATSPWRLTSEEWEAAIERVRGLGSRLFHADAREDADAVALVPSVAYAMSMVAASWPLAAGERVVMLDAEFPSVLLPWQRRCRQAGAVLATVGRERATADLVALIEHTPVALLVLTESHWRDGRRIDLDQIARAAHARGIPLVLDLSQSLGVLPCDVARWRPAFAMSVTYKWLLGGKGLTLLWAAPEWRERIEPLEGHWQTLAPETSWWFEAGMIPAYRPGARRFDAGEIPDMLRLAVTEAGLRHVLDWSPGAIAGHLDMIIGHLARRLADAGLAAWCITPRSPHLLGLRPDHAAISAVRSALRDNGIVCIERDGVFRVAPHLHVDTAQMDVVANVLIAASHRG